VISPENIILDVKSLTGVNIPLVDGGPIGVKPGHHPLIAETSKGTVTYEDEAHRYTIDLHAGVLEIRNDMLTILTAGKVNEAPEDIITQTEVSYQRMMETLISNLYPQESADEVNE
jgi:F0F1-type ATP synthase epsilon subunit